MVTEMIFLAREAARSALRSRLAAELASVLLPLAAPALAQGDKLLNPPCLGRKK